MIIRFSKTKIIVVYLFILFSINSIGIAQNTPLKYRLVWSDEFNYQGLPDSAKWNYETGKSGWGNNELEDYTAQDTATAKVSNGYLYLRAQQKMVSGAPYYTSARLTTKNKGDWKYGKIEVRAKLPQGRGLWPAIWMLSTDWEYGGWPASGEIDIMEHVGYMKDSIFGSLHSKTYNHVKGTQKTKGVYIAHPYSEFHVFGIEWTPDEISFLLDGKIYYKGYNEHKTFAEWPFDKRFHLLLNMAVGGNWGGKKGVDESVFPATMLVDYVRVYQAE
ncbi:MAG: glycoside hydrolase family 16 protein [Chitinophagaceae bacterium]|jgi:beta-glucanase (GH16 family)|nr:glycoside hydrolase family 16 protein [Chitinophagaceae bacterium]